MGTGGINPQLLAGHIQSLSFVSTWSLGNRTENWANPEDAAFGPLHYHFQDTRRFSGAG